MYAKEALEWVYQETKEAKRLLALAERNNWQVVRQQAEDQINMLEWLQERLLLEVGSMSDLISRERIEVLNGCSTK